jgi:hypothetical protein
MMDINMAPTRGESEECLYSENETSMSVIVDELINLGAYKNRHSNRTLLDHLLGVFQILHAWGNSKDLCFAGLFHSIYGTSSYKTQTVSIENRQHIKNLIGDEAEELAFLFCVHDTKSFIEQSSYSNSFELVDASKNKILAKSKFTFNSISEIHIANIVEQVPFLETFIDKDKLVNSLTRWLPVTAHTTAAAKESFKAALAGLKSHN